MNARENLQQRRRRRRLTKRRALWPRPLRRFLKTGRLTFAEQGQIARAMGMPYLEWVSRERFATRAAEFFLGR